MKQRISIRHLAAALSLLLLMSTAIWIVQRASAESLYGSASTRKPQTYRPSALLRRTLLQVPAQGEKTAEQEHKNIQVLKGLPDWQLIPVMNFMSASLGVKCNYCHVNNAGNWVFESDDKPEKGTAREMIKMVMSVNKTTFRGNTEVSCYTCHRGRTSPVGVPTLPLPEAPQRTGERGAGGAGSAGGTGAPAAQAAPTADEILNKYIAAIGGQAAIDKLKTRVMKGTAVNASGMSMTYEVDQSSPDRFHVLLSTERGSMERGFNGSVGWEKTPAGVHEITGQQLEELKHAFQLIGDLKLKEQFTRMSVGKDKIDGKDVYVIRAVRADRRRERLYFDPDTGLLVRRLSFTDTPIGVIPQQTDFEDYRDVDGIKIPFTIRVSAVDTFSTGTRKFTDIKINVPVDDSKFNKPAATTAPSH